MAKRYIPILIFVMLLGACVPDRAAKLETRPAAARYSELSELGVERRFVAFIVQESLRAKVAGFRPLSPRKNAARKPGTARLYGLTKRNRIIYLDSETAAGRSPFIILHEVAHAAHYGGACGGHHSTWAAEFESSAARFQHQFPNDRWLGLKPVAMARALARQYGIGTTCP